MVLFIVLTPLSLFLLLAVIVRLSGGPEEFGQRAGQWIGYRLMKIQRHRMFSGPGSLHLLWGPMCDAVAEADARWVAGLGLWLGILEETRPGILVVRSKIALDGFVHDIDVRDGKAYVAAGIEGLLTVDISNPDRLKILDRISPNGYAMDFALYGDRGYLALKDGGGLLLVDIDSDGMPHARTTWAGGRSVRKAVRSGNHLFLAQADRIDILDLSTADAPVIGTIEATSYSRPKPIDPVPSDLAVRPPYLYVTMGMSGLAVYNVSDPAAARLVTRVETGHFLNSLAVQDDLLVTEAKSGPLSVFDIQDPTSPRFVSSLPAYGKPSFSILHPRRLLVADRTKGVKVFDLTRSEDPVVVSAYGAPPFSYDVTVHGNVAYTSDGGGGVGVYRLSPESDPGPVYRMTTPGHAHMSIVMEERLWIADTVGGLALATLEDPLQPRLHSALHEGNHVWSIFPTGRGVVLADGQHGLSAYDVRGGKADFAGEQFFDAYAIDLEMVDNRYFAATLSRGVMTEAPGPGASQPTSLMFRPPWVETPSVSSLAVFRGRYLLIGSAFGKVRIAEVKPGGEVVEVGDLRLGGPVFDLAEDGSVAWAAVYGRGMAKLDLSDPARPRITARGIGPKSSMGLAVSSDELFVAAGEAGLVRLSKP